MTLMVRVAEQLRDDATVLDIIRAFSASMTKAQTEASAGLETIVGAKGDWKVPNPVYAGSLIDDEWTDRDMEAFFRWSALIAEDLKDLAIGGERSKAAAQLLFGKGSAAEASLKALPAVSALSTPSTIANGHKPWRGAE